MASGFADRARTLDWLRKTYDARSGWMPFVRVEPELRRLRDDPAYRRSRGAHQVALSCTLVAATLLGMGPSPGHASGGRESR